jgi:hypothetical protein
MRNSALLSLSLLTACGGIPRDPEGTSERIGRDRIMQVGLVDGANSQSIGRLSELIEALSKETGAKPVISRGGQETLLIKLEAGDLDLVLGGRFVEDTPWKTRVTLGPPLASQTVAASKLQEHAVTRNGENAWIVRVQREARAIAAR